MTVKTVMKVMVVMGVMALPLRAQDVTTPTPQPIQRRGWFGISLSCEDCFIQRGNGRVAYTQRPGISWVDSHSPAYDAGLRSGDTIVSVNGASITTPEGFEQFANAVPGSPVRLTVRHSGQERDVTVTPIESAQVTTTVAEYYNSRLRLAQRLGLQALRNGFRSPLGWLGMGLECEQCSINGMSRRQNWSFREAPQVLTVDVDGPAHRAGLRRGDTLTTIDGVDLTTAAGGRLFAAVEPGQRVTLGVRRGGAERRVVLVAVARPDASQEEIAAFDEYKRARDSSDASYREMLSSSVQRATAELRALELSLRDMDASRTTADSTRRRIQSIDSLMRILRRLEQRKYSDNRFDFSFDVSPRVFAYAAPPTPPTAPMAPMAGVGVGVGVGVNSPVRYSGRLGSVNVEARSYGPVNAQEVGDSVIVVNTGGAQIKVYVRPNR